MLQTMCLGHFKDFLPQIFSGSILLFCTLPLVCRSKNAEGQAQANGPGRSFHFVNATFPLHGFLPIVPQTGFETLGSLGYVVGNKLCGFVQGRMRMRRRQCTPDRGGQSGQRLVRAWGLCGPDARGLVWSCLRRSFPGPSFSGRAALLSPPTLRTPPSPQTHMLRGGPPPAARQ